MWGQGYAARRLHHRSRIIPMRVGTSLRFFAILSLCKDHPHACGDKPSNVSKIASVLGSSPCVWGQAVNFGFNAPELRIIPMRVGTSAVFMTKPVNVVDHPHACGDKMCDSGLRRGEIGSSPCVWGQGQVLTVHQKHIRIIPMRVGTSADCHSTVRV